MTPAQQAIVRAAREQGIDPAFALAVASRESNFNPTARASKTIRGMFQMRGDLRNQYGVGDSDDPYAQATGWGKFITGDVKKNMARVLGRDPTDEEAYLGHHFGARRAARMLQDDPNTPVDAVFTPQEMALNPHFGKAGTIGVLNSSVMADIDRRKAQFGGQTSLPDLSSLGEAVAAPDLSSLGEPVEQANAASAPAAPDLSSLGEPV